MFLVLAGFLRSPSIPPAPGLETDRLLRRFSSPLQLKLRPQVLSSFRFGLSATTNHIVLGQNCDRSVAQDQEIDQLRSNSSDVEADKRAKRSTKVVDFGAGNTFDELGHIVDKIEQSVRPAAVARQAVSGMVYWVDVIARQFLDVRKIPLPSRRESVSDDQFRPVARKFAPGSSRSTR